MKKILIMCPSRSSNGNRIQNLIALHDSWKKTTTGNSDFLLGIDENDKHHYPLLSDVILDINSEQLNVVKKINYLAKKYISNYEFVYFIGDDCLFETSDWEEIYLKAAKEKQYVMFYPNDKIQNGRLPTHPFMSAEIIRKIGFMGPECLQHMYVDNFWKSVGQHLGCLKYFPDVIIDHRHPARGFKSDDLYKRNDSYFADDQKNYLSYMKEQFEIDMEIFRTKEKK